MLEPISEKVKAQIALQFPKTMWVRASQELEQYQLEETDRVRLAALTLAQDDLLELRLCVQEAQRDYRDILMTAEKVDTQQSIRMNWQSFPVDAAASLSGWLTCPGCGRRFCLSNERSWNGQRHRRCGQRIQIVAGPEQPAI